MRICREGWPFIGGSFVITVFFLVLAVLYSPVCGILAGIGFLATAFCSYFFRDPARTIPLGDRLVLSPADGVIMEIIEGSDAAVTGPVWILRIFLSVFAPHLQRAPIAGRVRAIRYQTGKFLDARDPKAAFENEQNRIEISGNPAFGGPLIITQIAGLIARRIVCWVRESQEVKAGERVGLIRFGSQVDMVIPKVVQLNVKTGDHVTAGDTVIGHL